jgi:hypothetical protein
MSSSEPAAKQQRPATRKLAARVDGEVSDAVL